MTSKRGTWAFYLDRESDETLKMISDLEIFPSNMDIVIFAAAVGREYNCYVETKQNGSGYRWEGPAKDKVTTAWYLAFSKTKNPDILLDDNECYKVLASYANGGFQKIQEWADDAETTPGFLMNILNEMESIQLSH